MIRTADGGFIVAPELETSRYERYVELTRNGDHNFEAAIMILDIELPLVPMKPRCEPCDRTFSTTHHLGIHNETIHGGA